ncbi:MAG: UvrD-helicase domain-containing protein [bacterium]
MTKIAQNDFKEFIKKNLNKPQQNAAIQEKGSILVIAGAGSGKTRVITSRITHLILEQQIDPLSIVALTFTNKAAGEMKERILKFLGARHELPFVGTFHSYCLFLLRSNPTLLPFPQFSIMDTDDKINLIKKIIKKNALEKLATAHQLNYQLSQIKNKLQQSTDNQTIFEHPIIKEIYLEYEAEKASCHCFDFDDLILQALHLFKNEKKFKKSFQEKIKHILVDEYQDTSHTQHELLRHMALNHKEKMCVDSLCVVGDEDQSIYSWRGATVANMLKFKNDFAPVTSIKIEQNYRSVTPILEAANSLIQYNKLRNPKELWSDKKATNRILDIACRSGEQEADIIATLLKNFSEKKALNNAAILYRTHYQSRILEEALIYYAIPYRIIGGIRFYERREIKDLLAYLRLVVNPYDKISLTRIINVPLRGLGEKFEQQLMEEWVKNPFFDFKQLLKHIQKSKEINLPAKKSEALDAFLEMYQKLDPCKTPIEIIDIIIKTTDYLNFIRNTFDTKEAETKIENVQEFVRSISTYQTSPKKEDHKKTDVSLENFLHEVSLMQEKTDDEEKENQVQLMTLHAAKGLEFDTIIIAGLEEGVLPSNKSLTTNEELEEERRLFYVGITRAKEHLALTHASYRNSYGQISDQVESRFLGEIAKNLMTSIDAQNQDAPQIRNTLRSWLGLKPAPSNVITFGRVKPAQTITPKSKPRTNKKSPHYKISGSTTKYSLNSLGGWTKNQQVFHKKFGIGIITDVQEIGKDEYHITAIFKAGKKTILSSFLTKQ